MRRLDEIDAAALTLVALSLALLLGRALGRSPLALDFELFIVHLPAAIAAATALMRRAQRRGREEGQSIYRSTSILAHSG